ncbi:MULTISPECIES: UDP-N-acetylmuramoyl-L-alanyl-D-glutamate--2,6-diaminopimelate ligase [unclassified Bartonella]|uniref:UDP-N-acetylmuramoyl-L-alanyl-D-glutamate--2, 6-diaminopimelate ligase n=1 Tax=unclassified Bartonella TaxID=2645622 RepID=UPI0015FD594A|nr:MULTISPECIES: UDP-N-acetylmuramoyl-L-alanyl-D-glutamate--2,6-diaminopimelate ligase [unclassified Bartonella]UXN05573.1 UDP-N-acetylmuramoyl-L-alanyl-D-glutamate--2,6-diaminopimelate ligase [Bartonella sp. HY761]
MKLADLLGSRDISPTINITGLTADSREVLPGYVFFALKGNAGDGQQFISDAIKHGASAVISEKRSQSAKIPIPFFEVDDVRHALAMAASRFYPRQPEVITAVTGTSGKTSVVSLLRQIWWDTGFAGASIGTVGVFSPKISRYAALTTPGPVELHRVLQELNDEGVTHLAMEASSHGIDQRRLDGVRLSAAAFTNLGRDHLDYHANLEEYFNAKMRLFNTLLPMDAPAIIYADNKYSEKAIEHVVRAKRKVLTVGRKGSFIRIKRVEHERYRQYAEIEYDNEIYEILLPLAGDFQIANALVAAGIAIATGVPGAAVFRALERVKGAPGRLDLVGTTSDGGAVYVDYAHKPDAMDNVLKSVRPFTKGKVIVVFGCGGDRDKGKRAIMGEIASNLADIVIVTDDNPRSENPDDIRRQILKGATNAIEIGDRRAAIREGVALMGAGDTLIIAGKGHEEGQIIGSKVLPFSDHAEVHAALEARSR